MREACLEVRLFGGAAFAIMQCWDVVYGTPREIRDIDVVTTGNSLERVMQHLNSIGGKVNKSIELIDGKILVRGKFMEVGVDIYTDPLYLNRKIFLGNRLTIADETLSYADLLATKLQMGKDNTLSDLKDVIALIINTPISCDSDLGSINAKRISQLCAEDWIFYHNTLRCLAEARNAVKLSKFLRQASPIVSAKIGTILASVEGYPKSWSWLIRGWFGKRALQ